MGHSPVKCSISQAPSPRRKVDIFLKFCLIFNEQTLKTDAPNYNSLIVNQIKIFSALSKEKSVIMFTRYVTRRFFNDILHSYHSYNKYWFICYKFEKQCFPPKNTTNNRFLSNYANLESQFS